MCSASQSQAAEGAKRKRRGRKRRGSTEFISHCFFSQHPSSFWSAWSRATLRSRAGEIRGKSSQTLRIFSTRRTCQKKKKKKRGRSRVWKGSPFNTSRSKFFANLPVELFNEKPKNVARIARSRRNLTNLITCWKMITQPGAHKQPGTTPSLHLPFPQ